MSSLLQRRHRRHANPFSLRGPMAAPDFDTLFGRHAPLALDIGCGTGLFTVALALLFEEYNVLGVEMRQHLVELTQARASQAQAAHVCALRANASTQLLHVLPAASVAFVAINFPDPWYKKRHHKRRIVQPAWLAALRPKLIPGANLHAMTDYKPVAEHMRAVFNADDNFVDQHPSQAWPAASCHSISSEREQTHVGRQEPIYRLHFRNLG